MSRASSIRQGSFRGVQFLYQDSELDGGRRIARHEYPQREKGYAEDMGRRMREFTLDIFVLGDDWTSQRDGLLGALEKPGAGTLVHPVFGTLSVTVPTYRQRESSRALGRADFQVTFLEAGDISFSATAAQATGSQVAPAAASANTAMQAAATQSFSISGFAQWLQISVQGAVKDVTGFIGDALAPVASALGIDASGPGAIGADISAAVWSVSATIDGVEADVFTLMTAPSELMSQVSSLLGGVSGIAFATGTAGAFGWGDVFAGTVSPGEAALGAVLQQQQALASTGLTPLPSAPAPPPAAAATTPGPLQDAANRAAIASVVRVAALAEAAQAAVAYPWQDSGSAADARDALADLIDAESLLQTDGATVQALAALRLALIREMNAVAAQLPALLSVTLTADLPAVVAAFRIYGDPSWTEDIVARNDIVHPLFVPAGTALEILGTAAAAA